MVSKIFVTNFLKLSNKQLVTFLAAKAIQLILEMVMVVAVALVHCFLQEDQVTLQAAHCDHCSLGEN